MQIQLKKRHFVAIAILIPVLAIGAFAVYILSSVITGTAKALLFGPNIVQSVQSPDGTFIAYVIDKPSIDGPNHHLYVKDIGTQKETFVANLPEDVDFNKDIIWSPQSDIVVFQTHFKLIAFSPLIGQTHHVKLGGDHHWRKNGTFWVDYKNVKVPTDLQFPEKGVFTYHLAGQAEVFTLRFS